MDVNDYLILGTTIVNFLVGFRALYIYCFKNRKSRKTSNEKINFSKGDLAQIRLDYELAHNQKFVSLKRDFMLFYITNAVQSFINEHDESLLDYDNMKISLLGETIFTPGLTKEFEFNELLFERISISQYERKISFKFKVINMHIEYIYDYDTKKFDIQGI